MKNLINKMVYLIIRPLFGKIQYQIFFESLHLLALQGMNFGGGSDLKSSGEIHAIKYVISKIGKYQTLRPLLFFDVGANVGNYSKIIYELLQDKDALIYSFEPSKATFEKLANNLSGKKNVFINNFGFGDENKKQKLFYDSEKSGLASVYDRRLDHFDIEMNLSEEIEIRTIDSFCSENKIDFIHFLKLDVEGHELKVLKGAERLIKNRSVDYIQFEFGGCNIDSRTFFQDFYYLLNKDYKIYRILKNGLRPINSYKETQEIFITTNYLAEKIQ